MPICSVRGKAFCALPSIGNESSAFLMAPIDFLMRTFELLVADAPGEY